VDSDTPAFWATSSSLGFFITPPVRLIFLSFFYLIGERLSIRSRESPRHSGT
jgi:hypothetical protein